MSTPSIEPSDADVVQEESPVPLQTVPVQVMGPTRTVELPAKTGGLRRVVLDTATPQKILGRDPRRKRAVVQVYTAAGAIGTSQGAFLGNSRNECTPPAGFAFRLGLTVGTTQVASHLLEITSQDEVWAIADTQACEISVSAELWAD